MTQSSTNTPTDDSLHVVVVDEELPFPTNSGKRIRTVNLLLDLATRHKITYLCHRNASPEETKTAKEFFNQHGIDTILVDRTVPSKSGLGFYFRLFANLFSRLPYSVQTHTSREMQDQVKEVALRENVDLWQCEWSPYAQNVLELIDQPCIVMAHNVESLIWQRLWENEHHFAKRWYIKQQWRKFKMFEQRIFSEAPLTITVSETDAQLARTEFQAHRVAVVENGVDVEFFSPDQTSRDANEILFLGSLDWRANQDGVRMLLDDVLPLVRESEPQAKVSIVGRKPPDWLAERARTENHVTLFADVPDVRPYLRRCGALAVSLRVGGGSRLKILEALGTSCPVVSTAVGAEGLNLEPNQHYLQGSSPKEMADALVRCIRCPGEVQQMAQAGREVVLQEYDWRILTRRLEQEWLETASRSS